MDWRTTSDIDSEIISLATAKNYLKIPEGVTTEDDLITSLIIQARQKCEEYKGVAVAEKTIELTLKGEELIDNVVALPVYPVISITSVTPYDNEGTAQTALESGSGYYQYGVQRREVEILQKWFSVGVGAEDIVEYRIVFIAGYGDDTETLPEGFKSVMLEQISIWYYNRNEAKVLSSAIREELDHLFGINVWI